MNAKGTLKKKHPPRKRVVSAEGKLCQLECGHSATYAGRMLRDGRLTPTTLPCPICLENPRPRNEVIKQRLRGIENYKRDEEYSKRLSDGLRKAWKEGRKKSATANLPEPVKRERSRKISLKLSGTHGHGVCARDSLRHPKARHWIIRSPLGTIYEMDNLESWCRNNEQLFKPDDHPDSKLALWKRAVQGIRSLGHRHGKTCSWRGWTLVSVVEREIQGAPDLLARPTSS